ncbi:MAG: SIMPL domain-containing protein [Pseudomonadota bacterium]|jgi:uncharacterized protein YggE|nr:SIMPL domain-containing protein [Pseudomonadota bacterium]
MKHLLILALAFTPTLALAAVSLGVPTPATLQVSAGATVDPAPDRVYIEVGVRTEALQPKVAAADNASRVANVLAAVRKAAGPEAQLTTADYSLAPQYQYSNSGKPPAVTGYTVTNLVRVRLDDLKRIGSVIDAANEAGANVQQSLRFALRHPEVARVQALTLAARRARAAAGALAAALGLRIVRILAVRQSGGAVRTPAPMLFGQVLRAQRMAPATPIESGSLQVSADVSLTVAVAPR